MRLLLLLVLIVGCCTLKVEPKATPCSKTVAADVCRKADKVFRKYAKSKGFIILKDAEVYIINRSDVSGINSNTVGYCEYFPWMPEGNVYILSDYLFSNLYTGDNWKILWTILHEKGHCLLKQDHTYVDPTDLMAPFVPDRQPMWFKKLVEEVE